MCVDMGVTEELSVLVTQTVQFFCIQKIPIIPAGTPIHQYFDEEISFKPMFECLYPRQMAKDTHGLDLVWEVQLLVDDLIDQELIGNNDAFINEDFYYA